jgi:hypothetical protein
LADSMDLSARIRKYVFANLSGVTLSPISLSYSYYLITFNAKR